ncbi:F-box domain containing protein expressed [Citrus sinensis]|uniref:KIB1-4 beta-propeller domain-containing protein n=1 Tax=Citrus clementina TaxID=85681 RepID=V4TNX7_CITCL|nr:putative F-box protein At5g55150 [Citrus x clementina]XP_052294395.1 putative F-box protein At5g55150 [Citrus sinensis]ESR53395.1 hypothetical protein CICLE_v10024484mg [Citrus x clementina]KAH9720932.1 F-box domain containing protein expressed [Citrus sinensis]
MGNWSELNNDLLIEVAQRLTWLQDLVAFGGVCSSWRFVATVVKLTFNFNRAPWLMLAPEKCTDQRRFFSLSKGMTRQFILPEANGKKCFSSKGWLITIAQDLSMSLLHPFSRRQIKLPHIKTIKNWRDLKTTKMYANFIFKCALSSSPDYSSNYTIVISYVGKLAYARPGDRSWIPIDLNAYYHDIIFYNGLLYAVKTSQVRAFDIRGNNPTVVQEVSSLPSELLRFFPGSWYVAESTRKLLVIVREGSQVNDNWSYGTTRFQVLGLDFLTNTWTEVENLGDRALFLGHNSSFSVDASISHCKANCIYFTDDCVDAYWYIACKGGGKDMGIYDLQEETIEPFFKGDSYNRITPPMWVEKNFI